MTHVSAMNEPDSLQKLPRHSKDSFRLKLISTLTVVRKNTINRRPNQLKDQTLVDFIRTIVRKRIK